MFNFIDYLLQEMYIGLVLNNQNREALNQRFPPKYSDFIGHHITLEFGVHKNAELPPQPKNVQVIGYADDGDSIEALVVSIDGVSERPDGGTYHITWSLDRSKGRKPVDSNKLLTKGYQRLDNPINVKTEIKLLG